MNLICKVEKWVQQPDVQTQNGMTSKAQVVLRALGGKNAESYVGTVFGNMAANPIAVGKVVAAEIKFFSHEYEGKHFQDVNVFEMVEV